MIAFTTDALVVTPGKTIDADLAKIAAGRNWPLMLLATPRQVIQQIRICRPVLVIVEVSRPPQPALDLIRALTQGFWKVPVYVVALGHNEEIERAVRTAGATCYLQFADATVLDKAISERLPMSPAGELKPEVRAGLNSHRNQVN